MKEITKFLFIRYLRTHTKLREKQKYDGVVKTLFVRFPAACVTFAETITADSGLFKAFALTCPEQSVRKEFVEILLVVLMETAQHRVLDAPPILRLLKLLVDGLPEALQHAETSNEFIELVGGLCQIGSGIEGDCLMQIIGVLVRLGGVEAMLNVLSPALLGDEANMYVPPR